MIETNSLQINVADNPKSAPNYRNDGGWKAVDIDTAVVVLNGTESGKATVDFQISSPDSGERYVAMLTGELVKQLAATIEGAERQGLSRHPERLNL